MRKVKKVVRRFVQPAFREGYITGLCTDTFLDAFFCGQKCVEVWDACGNLRTAEVINTPIRNSTSKFLLNARA